jgi:hypothetical protein
LIIYLAAIGRATCFIGWMVGWLKLTNWSIGSLAGYEIDYDI